MLFYPNMKKDLLHQEVSIYKKFYIRKRPVKMWLLYQNLEIWICLYFGKYWKGFKTRMSLHTPQFTNVQYKFIFLPLNWLLLLSLYKWLQFMHQKMQMPLPVCIWPRVFWSSIRFGYYVVFWKLNLNSVPKIFFLTCIFLITLQKLSDQFPKY